MKNINGEIDPAHGEAFMDCESTSDINRELSCMLHTYILSAVTLARTVDLKLLLPTPW